jgi:glycosyltransferase involved in cell wall biosynthesis
LKKKLNILFLSSWYPTRVSPLNGDFIQRHAEAVSLSHTVTVIHVITDPKAKRTIEIVDTEIRGVRTIIAYIQPSFTKIFRFVSAYFTLIKMVEKIDIIHVNKFFPVGIIALYLKTTKRIKYLISEHHHIYYTPFNKKIGIIEKQISKIITRNASYICPVTNDLGNAMQKFGLKGRYHKVGNVVKTDIFKPSNKEKNTRFTLLHVSGKTEVKNVKGIIETLAKLQSTIPDFIFYLIGERAEEYKELADSVAINPNNIVFIEQLSQSDLASYYQKAAVFVLFSKIETFSIVVYEAFSSGTPVVSSDLPAIRENFPENYGVLVKEGNTKQLLDGILKIYNGFVKESPCEMHAYVDKSFSAQAIADQFSVLYEKMLTH